MCNFQKTLRVGCQESFLARRHRGRDLRRAPGRGHLEEAGDRGKIDQGNVWNKVSTLDVAEVGEGEDEGTASATVPCLCYHQGCDVVVVVHVGDFLCSGEPGDLAWFRGELENSFELKSQVVGDEC